MTTVYIFLAILSAALQILFIFLLTKEGRKEALKETEKNLVETFKNLDSATKTELLLNANLNNEEMILLVNDQTKSSAIEIVSATMNKFELVEKDIKSNNQELKTIKVGTDNIIKNTASIETKIDNASNNVNPKDFSIDMRIEVDNGLNTDSFFKSLIDPKNSFKIWITFIQDDLEMYTYLDSMGKWQKDVSMKGDPYYGHPYTILISYNDLKIIKGDLKVQNINKNKMFKADKKIKFKVHYTGSLETFNVITFNIQTKEGAYISVEKTEKENTTLSNSIISEIDNRKTENTIALSGYFKIK